MEEMKLIKWNLSKAVRFLRLRQGKMKTEVSKLPKMTLEQSEIVREVSKKKQTQTPKQTKKSPKTKTQKRSTEYIDLASVNYRSVRLMKS